MVSGLARRLPATSPGSLLCCCCRSRGFPIGFVGKCLLPAWLRPPVLVSYTRSSRNSGPRPSSASIGSLLSAGRLLQRDSVLQEQSCQPEHGTTHRWDPVVELRIWPGEPFPHPLVSPRASSQRRSSTPSPSFPQEQWLCGKTVTPVQTFGALPV